MKEFSINTNEAGQRFDKYLAKLLRNAPKSFLYKMLRKKNIVLNGKKATGNEKLNSGDVIRLFLSDDTFEKFSKQDRVFYPTMPLDILYEDPDILLINKPCGVLSQPDNSKDPSLVEYITGYLLENHTLTEEDFILFILLYATVWTKIPAVLLRQASLFQDFRVFPESFMTGASTRIISVSSEAFLRNLHISGDISLKMKVRTK